MRNLASLLVLVLWVQAGAANEAATASVNATRAAKGLSALTYSGVLEKIARDHAKEMHRKGYFSHKGSNGSTVGKRAKKAGYRWCRIAENIAKGPKNLGQLMKSLRRSPPHYKNLVRKSITEFAVAREGEVWVMVLGARNCRRRVLQKPG